MPFHICVGNASEQEVDTLVHFCFEREKPAAGFLRKLDGDLDGLVSEIFDCGEFNGKLNSHLVLRRPNGWKMKTIILAGLGQRSDCTVDRYRQAAGSVSRLQSVRKSQKLLWHTERETTSEIAGALVEGFELGRWKILEFKSDTDGEEITEPQVSLLVSNRKSTRKLQDGLARGETIARAVSLCRNLAFRPANFLTPEMLASEAVKLGRSYGFKTRVFDEKRIAKENMGALLAVGQGSVNPPRFIIMEHAGGRKGQQPIVLVGKGVTFDTGGISLKPGANMHEMKGDMTGAAVVISTMCAISKLKLKHNVIGLIASAENMPSAYAYKPGDIITARNGKTIEIINTDAEGRLVLADALDYANEFNPQAVFDIATLTGATLFSLGYAGAPIFGNNETMQKRLRTSSSVTGEKVWGFPLWPEYTKQMKSAIADLVNSGGRPAGSATAAAFLQEFIGDYPWTHIDIAYVDLEPAGQPYIPKGPSGFGVRLLVETLTNWKNLG